MHVRTDRVLVVVSVFWLAVIVFVPDGAKAQVAFWVTVCLIAANAVLSFRTLTHERRVLMGLSCAQIALFGLLNHQLHGAFDVEHYWCDREPRFYDWIEFTIAHVFRAADVLDALDAYGIPIQVITHNSVTSGLLLVAMHLTVDVFLLGLLLRWLSQWWQERERQTYLERGRRDFGWMLASLACYFVFAICLPLKPWDWLLWPIDNLLRLFDVGDLFQIFGWQLHRVEGNYGARAAGLVFRLVAGFWTARLVIYVRMTMMRTWGLSIEELTELLDDPDSRVRRGAAMGLGQSGMQAQPAVEALSQALRDFDPEVRLEAAKALGQIGPPARRTLEGLTEAIWLGSLEMRLASIEALGAMGPDARSAVHALVTLLKVGDALTCDAVRRALERIAPAVYDRLDEIEEKPSPQKLRKLSRRDYWKKSLKAAQSLRQTEELTRDLLLLLLHEGFFDQERNTDDVRTAFQAKGHEVQFAQLFLPLLTLTTDGTLQRRKSDIGRWVYVCVFSSAPPGS